MNPSEASATKNALRTTMRERLAATTDAQRSGWSKSIVRWLTHDDTWMEDGDTVAIFGGIKTEPDLLPLLPWFHERHMRAALFAIEGGTMTPYLVRGEEDFARGAFGVLEPKRAPHTKLDIADLTAVLVPGLAFGKNDGSRLGRGKGYFDRVLSVLQSQVRTVGVCFDLQLISDVPMEKHDVHLRSLVSESGWIEVD